MTIWDAVFNNRDGDLWAHIKVENGVAILNLRGCTETIVIPEGSGVLVKFSTHPKPDAGDFPVRVSATRTPLTTP
jgi:hypothetical protein